MITTIRAISRLFWPTREATKEENHLSLGKRHCFVTKSENRLKCSSRGYLDVKNSFYTCMRQGGSFRSRDRRGVFSEKLYSHILNIED